MPYDQLPDDVNSTKAQSSFRAKSRNPVAQLKGNFTGCLDFARHDVAVSETTFGPWKKMQNRAPLSIWTWTAFMRRSRCATVLHCAANRLGWAALATAAAS